MKTKNNMKLIIPSLSQNESLARSVLAAFASQCDPTVSEICDIKSAVSEAVTNCVVHAYRDSVGKIEIVARLEENELYIRIKDNGCGIENIEKAMMPMFTTCAEGERAGLGFAVMEAFMDKITVRSTVGKGTTVTLRKRLSTKHE